MKLTCTCFRNQQPEVRFTKKFAKIFKSSPAEFSTSQYLLNSALLVAVGVPGALPVCHPMGQNFFIFAYVSTKKCLGRRPAPSQMGWCPPIGNPGSAAALYPIKFSTSLQIQHLGMCLHFSA